MAEATETPQGPAEGQETEEKGPVSTDAPGGAPTDAPEPQPPQGGPKGPDGTLSGQPLRDVDEVREAPGQEVGGAAAVNAAARGMRLSEGEQSAALQWLLQSEPDAAEEETKTLELNFGTSNDPKWIYWVIKPVGIEVMRKIKNSAQNSRQARRKGQVDEYKMNLQVVVAGTVDPDVKLAAQLAFEQGNGSNDPLAILAARFQSKPGYVAQIAAEIMSLSGFDDDDVQEKDMVEAAGNS